MKIAQLSPLFESVPPRHYGGTERIVYFLTEELVKAGHEVTLFASGDSVTSAELRAGWPQSLWHGGGDYSQHAAPHLLMLEAVLKDQQRFDVIHSHMDILAFPYGRRLSTPCLHTLHGRLDYPELEHFFEEFSEAPLVSISDDQRGHHNAAYWAGTVYHGLPTNLYAEGSGAGGYLAFIGRFSRDKGVHTAIKIAKELGMPLKIAAKICDDGKEYFETEIKSLLHDPLIDFLGEIDDDRKQSFLGDAAAVLFPIEWPEPFGLVLIEAMACGTPVVATACGSVPEVLDHGVSGMICHSFEELVEGARNIGRLDRHKCRACFEARFTAARMAQNYLEIYRALAAGHSARRVPLGGDYSDSLGQRTVND